MIDKGSSYIGAFIQKEIKNPENKFIPHAQDNFYVSPSLWKMLPAYICLNNPWRGIFRIEKRKEDSNDFSRFFKRNNLNTNFYWGF